MRDYDWCNVRFRNRKPRSNNSFRDRWDVIEYDREKDVFKLRYNDITMHRDGSVSVTNVDHHLMNGYQQGWMQRVWIYAGVSLRYPKDRKLHAYITAGGRYITGDFVVTTDRKLICKAPLKRWVADKKIVKSGRSRLSSSTSLRSSSIRTAHATGPTSSATRRKKTFSIRTRRFKARVLVGQHAGLGVSHAHSQQ